MRLSAVLGLILLVGGWGCAARPASFAIHVHDEPTGAVRYEGPLAGPYDELSTLVDTACKHMKSQVADKGPISPGYCALFFHAPLVDSPSPREKWFIAHISPIGVTNELERSCRLPMDPVEPTSTALLVLGGGPTGLQPSVTSIWHPTLFLNQTTGRTWEHDVLVFSMDAPGTCAVYSFSGFSGVVTRRQHKTFVPVGAIDNGEGVLRISAGNTGP
ncbi:hypothetical protein [Archangium violaceum]|nr:hypothetical protein [Archangium violaceum]